jgi:bifunctional DNA-binding transcriptional regulator/antitoxin component of YhaV-PrlF toxin-antitoxin module
MARRRVTTGEAVPVVIGDKGRITLSDAVRRHLGVGEGDVVFLSLSERHRAEIVPAALVPRDQVWFLHPEVQARVAEAEADVEAGRTTAVRSPDDLRARLQSLREGTGEPRP